MNKRFFVAILLGLTGLGCGEEGKKNESLAVFGTFLMEVEQTENTCSALGPREFAEMVPFVFTNNSEGEIVPGDAILLFEDSPLVEPGFDFDFRVPLRQEDGEWLGLVIWDPDDEVTMLQYSGDFSGENGIADYHEATIALEYMPGLCQGGNSGRTVARVAGWRQN